MSAPVVRVAQSQASQEEQLRASIADKVTQLEARLLVGEQIDAIPAPSPLIRGVLYRDTITELWGKPGCGKSLLAMDWALCIASGKPWQGHQVTPGRVLYVVGEGVGGIGKRRRAWSTAWGTNTDQITWLREPVPLLLTEWVAALGVVVRDGGFDLVVFDTLSRAIAGQNENSSEVMSTLVQNVDWLRTNTGGAGVLFAHHSTKDGATNRGHSALEGACDVRWRLTKDSNGLTLSNDKSKDEVAHADIGLRLKVVPLGTGDDGEAISSAVLESHSVADELFERPASESTLMRTMRDSFGTTGATSTQLREVSGLPKTTFHRALNALVCKGELVNQGTLRRPLYVLSGWADHD